jgi:hypothetical protein
VYSIIIFDKMTEQPIQAFAQVLTFRTSFYEIYYETFSEGANKISGLNGPFIVVEDSPEPTQEEVTEVTETGEIGVPAENEAPEEPTPTPEEPTITYQDALNYTKKVKLDTLKAVNEDRIETGFEFNGDFFSFSKEKDQGNFTQQTAIISFKKTRGEDTSQLIEWKTENNGVKYYTEDEFFTICLASEQHKRNHIRNYWEFAQQVAATTYTRYKDIEALTLPELSPVVTVESLSI